MIRVITIGREFGSGGALVARTVADKLGWRLLDNALLIEIANAAKVNPDLVRRYDECVDPWFHRVVKATWHGGYEGSATRVEDYVFDAAKMAEFCGRAIEGAAEIGNCVVVGRGGQCILQKREDTFHVFVYAPLEERVARLRPRFPDKSLDDLAKLAEDTDRTRAAYIKRYFGQDWNNRHLYHMMLCSTIGLETAATAILCAAGLKGGS